MTDADSDYQDDSSWEDFFGMLLFAFTYIINSMPVRVVTKMDFSTNYIQPPQFKVDACCPWLRSLNAPNQLILLLSVQEILYTSLEWIKILIFLKGGWLNQQTVPS